MHQGMSQDGSSTGTRDETYNLVSVVYHALQGAENSQTYAQDVQGKDELKQFFDRACQMQKQLADEGKRLLHDQLMQGSGGGSSQGSAFSQFGSSEGGSSGMSGGEPSPSGSQQGMSGSMQDRQGGSAYTSGESVGAQSNDQSMGQFGQSPMGGGQRHNQTTTGGGGTSSF